VSRVRIAEIRLTCVRRLDFRGDPADEIIAATSLVYRAPLMTRDRRLRNSKIVPLAR
jgi:predicted nucleic acid-binding protein